MEDTRTYDVQCDHPAKLQVLTCIKLDAIIDQNKKIIALLEKIAVK